MKGGREGGGLREVGWREVGREVGWREVGRKSRVEGG